MPTHEIRSIFHLNIADFVARLETMVSPALKDRPVVISPLGAPMAVAYDMNEPAFRKGIRKSMPLSQLLSRHRCIQVLPPRFNRYAQAKDKTLMVQRAATQVRERFSAGALTGQVENEWGAITLTVGYICRI